MKRVSTLQREFNFAAVIGVLVLTGAASSAQGAEDTPEEVTITATGTAIRGVAPTGSAVMNISREELLLAPVREASEIIRNLPQGSGLGFSEVVGAGGGNNSRSSGVNLRGLGGNATLVLFNGHRLAGQGIINQFADPNQIPFAAIERVEIVSDGASAIYGSDAVAGVVNYIMRSDYQGFEAAVRHNTSGVNDTSAVDLVGGFDFKGGDGNVMIGITAENRGGFLRGERGYLRQDLRAYGGNDNRRIGTAASPGAPGNIVAGTQIYGLPVITSGIPTAAQVLPLLNQPNLVDSADFVSYLPERERQSAVLRTRYRFNDRAELTYSVLASKRTTEFEQFTTLGLNITSASPWYIPGLVAANGSYNVVYNSALNGRPNIQEPYEKVINHFADFTFDLGRDWQFTGSLVHGKTSGCGVCGPENNQVFPAQYAAAGMDPTLLNPYLNGTQSGIFRAVGTTFQDTKLGLDNVVARFEGPIGSVGGGQMRLSAGAEYAVHNHDLLLNQNIRNYPGDYQIIRDTFVERKIGSGFVEAFVPLFGSSNARRGLQKLDLSLAVRYDDYSDFGGTTNPKIGITWKPTPNLDVRGTWGKAFRAPTLTETNPQVISVLVRANLANGSGDPTIPITNIATGQTAMFQRLGSTPQLDPENAEVWSVGFDYEPEWLEGLRFSSTYYSVYYEDRIEAVPNAAAALATPANRALYAPFIVATPQPATCVNGTVSTYHPLLQALFATPFQNNLANAAINDCTIRGYVESGQQNLGDLDQRGIDLSVTYRFDSAVGNWQLGTSTAKILKLEKAFLAGGPMVDVRNTIGFQVKNRGTADIGWSRDSWSANLKANYVGSYLNNTPITVAGVLRPANSVNSWITYDLGVNYAVGSDGGGWASGLRLGLSAQNITDKDPPIVLAGQNAIDPLVHNPFGRIWALELSKRF